MENRMQSLTVRVQQWLVFVTNHIPLQALDVIIDGKCYQANLWLRCDSLHRALHKW